MKKVVPPPKVRIGQKVYYIDKSGLMIEKTVTGIGLAGTVFIGRPESTCFDRDRIECKLSHEVKVGTAVLKEGVTVTTPAQGEIEWENWNYVYEEK